MPLPVAWQIRGMTCRGRGSSSGVTYLYTSCLGSVRSDRRSITKLVQSNELYRTKVRLRIARAIDRGEAGMGRDMGCPGNEDRVMGVVNKGGRAGCSWYVVWGLCGRREEIR